MIVIGIVCVVLGFLLNIGLLWTLGIVLVVIGAALEISARSGRLVYGRRHWY